MKNKEIHFDLSKISKYDLNTFIVGKALGDAEKCIESIDNRKTTLDNQKSYRVWFLKQVIGEDKLREMLKKQQGLLELIIATIASAKYIETAYDKNSKEVMFDSVYCDG